MSRGIFIGATGQNVGKTTLCLGIFAGLRKRFGSVGFIKPVGQQHVEVEEGIKVDKDVDLIRRQFSLDSSWRDMSPVLIPRGFTRRFLDGETNSEALLKDIQNSFETIRSKHEFTLVEGTGHTGVGSIVDLNNAKVAKALNMDMVIIASAGLGSSFDEIALNKTLCDHYGVKVRGVILNRVQEDKRSMVQNYFPKALKAWGIPLLGCIPFNNFLSTPCMSDFATYFKSPLLSGERWKLRHFRHTRLVAGSLEIFENEVAPNELVITPGSRPEIVQALINKHMSYKKSGGDFEGGLIITGPRTPSAELIAQLQSVDLPTIHVSTVSYETMREITHFTAKIQKEDLSKVNQAIELVEAHIDFDLLC